MAMPYSSFESLRVWHDARRFTSAIYRVTNSGDFARDFGLRDQLRRAAISIMSNIAEGYERGAGRELQHFMRIARSSAAEARAQLYAAQDIGYLESTIAAELRERVASIARQIFALARRKSSPQQEGLRQ